MPQDLARITHFPAPAITNTRLGAQLLIDRQSSFARDEYLRLGELPSLAGIVYIREPYTRTAVAPTMCVGDRGLLSDLAADCLAYASFCLSKEDNSLLLEIEHRALQDGQRTLMAPVTHLNGITMLGDFEIVAGFRYTNRILT
jgi:hypothetical protein